MRRAAEKIYNIIYYGGAQQKKNIQYYLLQ
jgi:hypothetical protein